MRLWIRRVLLAALGLGIVGALVLAFQPQPVGVDLKPVRTGHMEVTVDEDGKTRIKERYVVSSPLTGRMARIELKPGHRVEAGKTVLTVLEPTDPALLDVRARAEAEARVKAAEAARKRAAAALKRAQVVHDYARSELTRLRGIGGRGVSAQELENAEMKERAAAEEERAARFAVLVADYELEMARAALLRSRPPSPGEADTARLELRSPIDGKVLRVFQESEAVVTPGQRLIELGNPDDLECEIDVLSASAVKIPPGARVRFEHWGGPEPLNGRVRLIEPAGFLKISALGVEEQRVWVIADFTDPPEKRRGLGDAYRVEARIVVWERDGVLMVPDSALFRHGDGWAVYVAEGGRAVLRPVAVGQRNGLDAEVLAGLTEGEQVIVHPGDKVKDGVPIAPRPDATASH